MKFFLRVTFILFIFLIVSCGKKSGLEKYPGSDYPKQYPRVK